MLKKKDLHFALLRRQFRLRWERINWRRSRVERGKSHRMLVRCPGEQR